ncbi:hypothetical protein B0H14DRAFT_3171463 [Mycena olivaceomarginata]|nr:hypothetical protein B0H14DRAFT_3171463 [Mycena olivaceomarginata]
MIFPEDDEPSPESLKLHTERPTTLGGRNSFSLEDTPFHWMMVHSEFNEASTLSKCSDHGYPPNRFRSIFAGKQPETRDVQSVEHDRHSAFDNVPLEARVRSHSEPHYQQRLRCAGPAMEQIEGVGCEKTPTRPPNAFMTVPTAPPCAALKTMEDSLVPTSFVSATSAFHVFSRPPSPPLPNEDSTSSLEFYPVATASVRSRSRSTTAGRLGASAGAGPKYQSLIEGPTTPVWSWDTQRKFHRMLPLPRSSRAATSLKCFSAHSSGRIIPVQPHRAFEHKMPSVVGNTDCGQASGFRNPSSIFPTPPSNMSLLFCASPSDFNDTSGGFPTVVIPPLDITMHTITSLGTTTPDASMVGTPRSLELSPEHEAHLQDMGSL